MSSHKSLPLSILLSTLLLLFVSVSCGTSAGAAAPSSRPPATTVQKCGTIGVRPGGNGTVNPAGDANSVGNCFWRAYQRCRAASLVVSFGGIDTITTHTFSVQQRYPNCTIADAVQFRVVPQPARNNGTFTCRGLVKTPGELRFSGCGMNGDIVVSIG